MVSRFVYYDDTSTPTAPIPSLHRTGSGPAGPQTAHLVPCAASKWHRHHPANEHCPECPPALASAPTQLPDWFVSVQSGMIRDANLYDDDKVRFNWMMYTPLGLVGRGSDTAAKICGCFWAPHRCKRYVDDRNIPISACDMPTIVKDPKWRLLP